MDHQKRSGGLLTLTGLLSFVVVFCLVGCSAAPPKKLRPGRCVTNEDCKATLRCVDTFCEDIYHPRRKIKNY
jgi:hypothetical protein